MRLIATLVLVALTTGTADAGPLRDRLRARFAPPAVQYVRPNPPAVVQGAPCVCGDSCKCVSGTCPSKCPVQAAPGLTMDYWQCDPVNGGVKRVAAPATACPTGKCPLK